MSTTSACASTRRLCRDGPDRLSDELDVYPGPRIRILEVVDELLQIFDLE